MHIVQKFGPAEAEIYAPRPGSFVEQSAWEVLRHANGIYGLDTEFLAFREKQDVIADAGPEGLRLIQLAGPRGAVVLDPRDPAQRRFARDLMTSEPTTTLIVHNGEAEAKSLYFGLGLDITRKLHDTYVDSLLLDPGINGENPERGRHGLKPLCAVRGAPELADLSERLYELFHERYGHVSGKSGEVRAHGFDNIEPDNETFVRYAGLDAVAARWLAIQLAGELLAISVELYERSAVEQQLAQITRRMELHGWAIDYDFADQLLADQGARNADAKQQFEAQFEWRGNPLKMQSPRRVDWLLARGVEFQELTDAGNPSLGKEEVGRLATLHTEGEVGEFLRLCAAFSETQNATTMTKSVLSYAGSRGRVHASIGTLNATTGRMSVTGPALQTVSWRNPVRGLFVADSPDHVLVGADLSQVEPKVFAVLAGEQTLIDQANAGIDIYQVIVDATGTPRKVVKREVLGRAYGSGVATMARQIRTLDRIEITDEAVRESLGMVDSSYPRFKALAREAQEWDPVWLPSGRFVPVDPTRLYKNVNSAVQGAARDLFGACIIALDEAGLGEFLIMPVHDETIGSYPADLLDDVLPVVRDCMCQDFMGLRMSTEIEIYPERWGPSGEVWSG